MFILNLFLYMRTIYYTFINYNRLDFENNNIRSNPVYEIFDSKYKQMSSCYQRDMNNTLTMRKNLRSESNFATHGELTRFNNVTNMTFDESHNKFVRQVNESKHDLITLLQESEDMDYETKNSLFKYIDDYSECLNISANHLMKQVKLDYNAHTASLLPEQFDYILNNWIDTYSNIYIVIACMLLLFIYKEYTNKQK